MTGEGGAGELSLACSPVHLVTGFDVVAWGPRLRAFGAAADKPYGLPDVAREASEVGIVPDYL